jgi:hypothetical protein
VKIEPDRTPDETYIAEALLDGRAKKTGIAMRDLANPDIRLQARVVHLNTAHIERLREQLRETGSLASIVVFREDSPWHLWLADGFHRHEVYRLEDIKVIPAYLCEGGYREALKFATMCNRQSCLARTADDKKKAAYMLFADREWFTKPARQIAMHIGCSTGGVDRWRRDYCAENKLSVPKEMVDSAGRHRQRRTFQHVPLRKTTEGFIGRINGQRYRLGSDKKAAEERFDKLIKESRSSDPKTVVCPMCRGKGRIRQESA